MRECDLKDKNEEEKKIVKSEFTGKVSSMSLWENATRNKQESVGRLQRFFNFRTAVR